MRKTDKASSKTGDCVGISRRDLVVLGAAALALPEEAIGAAPPPAVKPGQWVTARCDRQLTSLQTLAGKMRKAPTIAASIEFGKGPGVLVPFASKPGGDIDRTLSFGNGQLACYALSGKRLWSSHPTGLNFLGLATAADLDGDGRVELALSCGRPTDPLGAAALLDAETGRVRFRYDVETMSYWWTMKTGRYLPGAANSQLVVCQHAYPPDEKFGYIVLFEFERPGGDLKLRWRYDFDHYTCFPSILQADVDGDGQQEICVETHSKMWVMNAETGVVKQFIEWDVSPANVRSYGLIRFQDLNADGLPEFFCIGNFSHHHEVLLNEKGRFRKAWSHGWEASVTTQTIATTWPDPPIADVDGDGRLEMIVSLYGIEEQTHWQTRAYDALTGTIKQTVPGFIATHLCDVDGDGLPEVLGNECADPAQAVVKAARLIRFGKGEVTELWREDGARAANGHEPRRRSETADSLRSALFVEKQSGVSRLALKGAQFETLSELPPSPPKGPDLSRIPAAFGAALASPLVADVDGDGKNEVVHFHNGLVSVYRHEGGCLRKLAEYPSSCPPALADLDGDGALEIVTGFASPSAEARIEALRSGREPVKLWSVQLPPNPKRELAHGSVIKFIPGRFLGRQADDLYAYIPMPYVRSIVLDGRNGHIVWERGAAEGIQRYYAPTVNHGAVWDFDGNGRDDLVFTCPDYYCVADGATGKPLLGPLFPPTIFDQPSQGLYTFPAVLRNTSGDPTVCLVDGHYFQAAMSLRARPKWFKLPIVGMNRAGAEAFLRTREGRWVMGVPRQNGCFACIDAETGRVLWEHQTGGTPSSACSCDIDGDGREEFLVGTSHGHLLALRDAGGKAKVAWRGHFPASVGAPVVADADNDGASEILVALGDGRLCLLR